MLVFRGVNLKKKLHPSRKPWPAWVIWIFPLFLAGAPPARFCQESTAIFIDWHRVITRWKWMLWMYAQTLRWNLKIWIEGKVPWDYQQKRLEKIEYDRILASERGEVVSLHQSSSIFRRLICSERLYPKLHLCDACYSCSRYSYSKGRRDGAEGIASLNIFNCSPQRSVSCCDFKKVLLG